MSTVVNAWLSSGRVSRGPTCYAGSRHQIKGCGRKRAPPSIDAGQNPPQPERGLPRSQVLTVPDSMTHHTTGRSGPLITRWTDELSSDVSVRFALDTQPPQQHPQPPRHGDDGLLAADGVGHQLPIAPGGRLVVADPSPGRLHQDRPEPGVARLQQPALASGLAALADLGG